MGSLECMQTWAAVWSHSNPLMHPLVSVSLYLQTAKEADDEEAAVGGKKDKRKPPAGRGPYRVAIMLTGGSLLFLVHAHRAAHWPTDPRAALRGMWSGQCLQQFDGAASLPAVPPRPLGAGVGAKEMNAGDHPVIGMADILNNTGGWAGGASRQPMSAPDRSAAVQWRAEQAAHECT